MQTIGNYLKKEREARDISLSDVSDCTKISKWYLDCLEKDEYAKIPGEAYVKGYISSYAACVGINEHEALKLYNSSQIETSNAEKIKLEILEDKKRPSLYFLSFNKKTWLVLAFFILIILAIGVYYYFFQNQENVPADKSLEEPNKAIQPTIISKIEPSFPQGRQDGNSFQSIKQNGSGETIENKAGEEQHVNGISQIPAPLESHRPEKTSKEGVPYPPFYESSKLKDLTGPENDPTFFENNLTVIEATACSNINNRIPQGSGELFEWSMEKIYIWSEIKCERPPSSIRHIYYFRGEKVNDILLKIRSSHWRTWSFKTLLNKGYIGPWRVDITSVDGKLLQRIEFEIR
jgi:cytoskeletal protein RodZ